MDSQVFKLINKFRFISFCSSRILKIRKTEDSNYEKKFTSNFVVEKILRGTHGFLNIKNRRTVFRFYDDNTSFNK